MALWFDVVNSLSLSPEQRQLILRRIGSRIGKDGVLRVTSQKTRSQAENRELAANRFIERLQHALKQVPIRKKRRVSKGAKLRRMEGKKQRSILKTERSRKVPVED